MSTNDALLFIYMKLKEHALVDLSEFIREWINVNMNNYSRTAWEAKRHHDNVRLKQHASNFITF